MAVKLRLRRLGRRHLAYYQIVAADARAPRDGRFIEKIGTYDPHKKFYQVEINHEAALKWLKNGAIPTETVRSILSREGILLKLHLYRKGKSEEEIKQQYEVWKSQKEHKIQKQIEEYEKRLQAEREERLAHERRVRENRAAKIRSQQQAAASE
ncbi:MAG: 30S ribosomal protein S16 [Bacteroidia bacterium]|nr:30S ribosomal protein S16 [Bacteroidia bacterium]MDW8158827.1 30S ribosomal protein S16 [Bacteroidia bacterium]